MGEEDSAALLRYADEMDDWLLSAKTVPDVPWRNWPAIRAALQRPSRAAELELELSRELDAKADAQLELSEALEREDDLRRQVERIEMKLRECEADARQMSLRIEEYGDALERPSREAELLRVAEAAKRWVEYMDSTVGDVALALTDQTARELEPYWATKEALTLLARSAEEEGRDA